MIEVVTVSFSRAGKLYYFKPNGEELKAGDAVIVNTEKGEVVGKVIKPLERVPLEKIVLPLKEVIRKMTESDWVVYRQLQKEEEEALKICERKIEEHGLKMKLIAAQYAFNKGYLMFFFSADGRVDFRALVKDLAKIFRTRIELRQIGVRDVAKMLGGIGVCGQELCCSKWLRSFDSVSIKMSKAQYLSLNPSRMSGVCGRLMCCLRYEEDIYKEIAKKFPDVDTLVETERGEGIIKNINVFTKQVFVLLNDGAEMTFDLDEITVKDIKTIDEDVEIDETKIVEED